MDSNQYHFLDVMKFMMAICVIAIHSFLDYIPDYPVMEFVIRMAVPFFFVTTGFFLGKKLMKSGADRKDVCRRHIKKSLPRYLRWIAVYFPIALLVLFTTEQVWYKFAARYAIGVVLLGETPYAWPLWFLLTVVISVALIYLFVSMGMRLRYICFIGVAFMVAGYAYTSLAETIPAIHTLATKVLPPRILIGFGAVTIGIFMAYCERRGSLSLWVAAVLLLVSLVLYYNGLWASDLIGGAGIFVLAISVKVPGRPAYIHFRQCSMIIYFIHMIPLALLYIFVAAEPDMGMRVDFFLITTVITLLASLPLSWVMKRYPQSAIAQFI